MANEIVKFDLSGGGLSRNIVAGIAVDVSGGMNEKDIRRFLSETFEQLEKRQDRDFTIHLMFFDCEVNSFYNLGRNDIDFLNNIKLKGGGGTNIQPVFDHLRNKKIVPDYLLIFTDGYINDIIREEDMNYCQIFWIIVGDDLLKPMPVGFTTKFES